MFALSIHVLTALQTCATSLDYWDKFRINVADSVHVQYLVSETF